MFGLKGWSSSSKAEEVGVAVGKTKTTGDVDIPPEVQLKVNLTLVDISQEVENDDSKANKLIDLVKNEVLVEPAVAHKLLAGETTLGSEILAIHKNILRFVQTKDKYTALVSTLLKSRAFHTVHDNVTASTDGSGTKGFTVVDVPRTQYRKPYIPYRRKIESPSPSGKEEDAFPITISHQFPFVGIGQLDVNSMSPSCQPFYVGMDLVVFDGYNKKAFASETDFLDVFRDSFTRREWKLIQAQGKNRLEEFYVRWSMKEAYTKALGVGMGLDFKTFDTILSDDSSIYELALSDDKGTRIRGTVTLLDQSKPAEEWDYYFLPIRSNHSKKEGCVCICAGPIRPTWSQPRELSVATRWANFASLVEYHFPKNTES